MTIWSKFSRGWRQALVAAMTAAVVLLAAGAAMAVYEDNLYKQQKIKDVGVQAQILAASVTAALVFNDEMAAREYVEALAANPELEAAAVYSAGGKLVASYSRGAPPPATVVFVRPAQFNSNHLSVVVPVMQGTQQLGFVFINAITEPFERRLLRYAGIVLLATMAALIVAVLGLAHAALSRANVELERRAEALTNANAQLVLQMEERAKAEEALRQSQKMEAIGRLTGGIAHDFNNLLMIVSGYAQMLKIKLSDPKLLLAADAIHAAAARGENLTRQLLSFARRQKLSPQPVNLRATLETLHGMLARSLGIGIELACDVPTEIWPVEVDPAELELALLNIVLNARDAMPQGGRIGCVVRNEILHKEAAPGGLEGEFVAIAISDTGTGIAPEIVPKIFEPFFTTKPVDKGTGLGLAQVYGFSHQSGGTVTARSTPGTGTTITVYLPKSQRAVGVEMEALQDIAPTKSGEVVLLVEDNPEVRELTKTLLNQLGYNVLMASDAATALHQLNAAADVDIVFSDIVMPGAMNGLTLAQEIRERFPDIKILLTSGYNEMAKAAQPDFPILRKPYQLTALNQALRSVVGKA